MVKCAGCETELKETDANARRPCPVCGDTKRVFDDSITLDARVRDHALLELLREGQCIAVRESVRDGRITWADEDAGQITTTISGPSVTNENDTLVVCRTLVTRMNQLGESWNLPAMSVSDSDVDCVSTDAAGQRVLEIQVVRAVVDAAWWRSLARRKAEQVSGTAEQLSDLLMKAVNMKAKYLPPRQRARLVLAIDANRFAGFTLDAVVSATRRKYKSELLASGFHSVWVVGPSTSRTHRVG